MLGFNEWRRCLELRTCKKKKVNSAIIGPKGTYAMQLKYIGTRATTEITKVAKVFGVANSFSIYFRIKPNQTYNIFNRAFC